MSYTTQIAYSKSCNIGATKFLPITVSVVALLASMSPALSQNFTVQNGQTQTTTQTLATDGSVGTIEEGGTLAPAAGHGIEMQGNNTSANIAGNLSLVNDNTHGIVVTGNNAQVTVDASGIISTTGDGSWGIWTVGGTEASITNNGKITTNGLGSIGILASIGGGTIINNGEIETHGQSSDAISVTDSNNSVLNSGTILTVSDTSNGISATSNNNAVNNSGSILTTGVGSSGIYVFGTGNVVTNSGTISADASATSIGIKAEGVDAVVINSGTITSQFSDAIRFESIGNNTLTLNAGNVISGGLVFGAGTDTLNVGNGLSLHYTFDKAPDILNTNGAPSLVQGNVVDVVDTTSLAHIDNSLDSLLAGTFNMLASHSTSTKSGSDEANALGYAQTPADKWPAAADWRSTDQNEVWANGFAGLQANSASGSATTANTIFGGGVIGIETMLDPELMAGAFVGFGAAQLNTPGNTQSVDTKGQYAGLYGQFGDNIDLSIAGGVLQHASSRQVLNNLVASGIETVTADFNGYFVAPEVTFKLLEAEIGGNPTRTSLRGRYTFQHIDGYTESGADSILAVGARNIHSLDTRLKVEADLVSNNQTQVIARTGIDGQFKWGANSVTANLLGSNLTFDPGGAPNSGSVFVGLTANHQINENTNLFFDTELSTGTAHGFNVTAQAGFKSSF